MYRHRLNKRDEITFKIVRELLDYDPDIGLFTWKYRERHWFESDRIWSSWNTKHAGKPAFNYFDGKYLIGAILSVGLPAHRVAFLWMMGRWPEPEVDHINQIKTDNRWSNLREATRKQNAINQGLRSNNKSGVRGVKLTRFGTYYATADSKYLGTFKTIEEAAVVRQEYERKREREYFR